MLIHRPSKKISRLQRSHVRGISEPYAFDLLGPAALPAFHLATPIAVDRMQEGLLPVKHQGHFGMFRLRVKIGWDYVNAEVSTDFVWRSQVRIVALSSPIILHDDRTGTPN